MKKFLKSILIASLMLTISLTVTTETNAITEYNVENYGANGNDSLSDNDAIQKCLNLADGLSSVTVRIPAGTYYLDDALYIHSNTHLILDNNVFMVRRNKGIELIRGYEGNGNVGGYNQLNNVTIEGGIWDGNVKEKSSVMSPLMRFNHASNLTLKKVVLQNASGRHMAVLAGVNNAMVDSCTFKDIYDYNGPNINKEYYTTKGKDGKYDKELSYQGMEALHIDCISKDKESEPYANPIDGTVNKNVTVQNCTFKNVWSGLGSHYTGKIAQSDGLKVYNNVFDVKYTCINAYNVKNLIVKGNKNAKGEELLNSYNSIGKVENNSINCMKPTKTLNSKNEYQLFGIFINQKSNLTINNNIINNAYRHGILVVRDSTAIITKNTISSYSNGIQAEKTKVVIKSNKINKSIIGVALYGTKSGTSITSNNIIKNSTKHGIEVTSNSKVNSISNNTITTPKKEGIRVYDSTITNINKNTVTNSNNYSIHLERSTSNVTNNTVSCKKQRPVFIKACKGGVKGNIIKKSVDIGIDIVNAKGTKARPFVVSGNKVSNCKNNGIQVTNSTYVNILTNTCNSNKVGVYVKNISNSKLNQNTANKNKTFGINISKCKKITVNKNKAKSNKKKDLKIDKATTGSGSGNSAKKRDIANKKKFK